MLTGTGGNGNIGHFYTGVCADYMAYSELTSLRQRNSKTWADGDSRRLFASLAPLHYESELDSGVFDSAIDCTPQFVNNAQFNGWRITANGWHYALGQPAGKADGWVGFGGRGGQNWFQFRLARLGYLYVPSGTPVLASNFDAIGGAPTYTRGGGNLTSGVNTIDYGTEGSQPIEAVAQWNNLWTVNGSGVYVRWRIDGGQLKEEVVIPQAAREWIVANQPPTTPVGQTYFGLVFQIDWSDIPKRIVNGIERAVDDDFNDDDGGVELHDSLDRLLAFMPIDDAYTGTGHNRQSTRLRKRFWKDSDGNHYLAVGALVGEINALPAGDLIFDPTVNLQIGATGNDGYSDAGGNFGNTSAWVGDFSGNDEDAFFYFTSVTVPNSATVSSANFIVRRTSSNGTVSNVDTEIGCEAADNPSAPTTQAQHAGRTRTAAKTTFDPTSWSAGGDETISITSSVQEVINRSGWASGNTLGVLWDTRVDVPNNNEIEAQDYTLGAANAAKLDITYTPRSGGLLLLGVG